MAIDYLSGKGIPLPDSTTTIVKKKSLTNCQATATPELLHMTNDQVMVDLSSETRVQLIKLTLPAMIEAPRSRNSPFHNQS